MRAVLSSGSNMGDARAHLQTVADEFARETIAASSIYATAPWGNTNQPGFLNQSLLVDVDDTPQHLLARCQELEQRAHRVREERWGPRTLDLDLLDCHGVVVETEALRLPHPRMAERAFVLEPLREVAPDWRHPASGQAALELLAALPGQAIRRAPIAG